MLLLAPLALETLRVERQELPLQRIEALPRCRCVRRRRRVSRASATLNVPENPEQQLQGQQVHEAAAAIDGTDILKKSLGWCKTKE